jgi:predicted nucleic acid-binding protein
VILADTSDWIEMLEGRHAALAEQLLQEQVLLHPWVLGELALGNLADRAANLGQLSLLSAAPVVEEKRVMALIERHRLHGSGLGWVDCQLLASAKAMRANLWTQDRALKRAWERVFRA